MAALCRLVASTFTLKLLYGFQYSFHFSSMVTNSEEAKTEVAKIFFLRKFSCDFEGYGLGLGVLV